MDEATTGEFSKIRAEARRRMLADAYSYLIIVVTLMVGCGVSILISVHATHVSERKLCAVVTNADDTYRRTPPTTAAGREQAANFARLRRQLGCPPEKGE